MIPALVASPPHCTCDQRVTAMPLAFADRTSTKGRRRRPVEAVYPMAYETFADVADNFRRFIDDVYNSRRLRSALGYLSPQQFEDQRTRPAVDSAA